MKKFHSFYAIAVIMLLSACGGNSETATEEAESTTTANETQEINYVLSPESSELMWLGEVAGVYGHDGYIKLSEGNVAVKDGKITGGAITIDMTSIEPANPDQYADEDGKRASDLKAHLSTGDFFLVEEYPTATFEVKSHEGNKLVGDLTVRGTTKEETATITSMEATPEGLNAKAKLVFNRQDYKVAWVHFMQDMVLSDDIQLDIAVAGSPQ